MKKWKGGTLLKNHVFGHFLKFSIKSLIKNWKKSVKNHQKYQKKYHKNHQSMSTQFRGKDTKY